MSNSSKGRYDFETDTNETTKMEFYIAKKYKRRGCTFHFFFMVYILSLIFRIGKYVELRIESTEKNSNNDGYIWEPISPSDHYYFYADEFVQNLVMVIYFYYFNTSIQTKQKSQ